MKLIYLVLLLVLFLGCSEDSFDTPVSTVETTTTTQNIVTQNSEAATLYKKCQSCHGENGEINAFGNSAVIADFTKQEIIDALNDYKDGSRDLYGLGGLMRGQVSELTPNEVEILADYIANP